MLWNRVWYRLTGMTCPAVALPVLEPEQHHVHAEVVASEEPFGIEELLEHLVVGRDLHPGREVQLLHPELQHLGQGLQHESALIHAGMRQQQPR